MTGGYVGITEDKSISLVSPSFTPQTLYRKNHEIIKSIAEETKRVGRKKQQMPPVEIEVTWTAIAGVITRNEVGKCRRFHRESSVRK